MLLLMLLLAGCSPASAHPSRLAMMTFTLERPTSVLVLLTTTAAAPLSAFTSHFSVAGRSKNPVVYIGKRPTEHVFHQQLPKTIARGLWGFGVLFGGHSSMSQKDDEEDADNDGVQDVKQRKTTGIRIDGVGAEDHGPRETPLDAAACSPPHKTQRRVGGNCCRSHASCSGHSAQCQMCLLVRVLSQLTVRAS